ncbi:cobalt-precorrin-6Y C(5)-methyltransferase [Methanoculleus taiwanensis]|uniref:Cobalt-precorrin-6Y C(5)-methyltransferase n=1 Tax=Methanoculleus taiwanensis TaxID=1550565 RepID=A0A498H4W0_9EURY|nr:cobalt-precorrin-7 (C(5))-methyltransferase [Methanoculleus taiwanensis]RXE57175.1 cobalt-precorrin-6Y C(5)-methyltransferase [Methanoculleus taiwanensis]
MKIVGTGCGPGMLTEAAIAVLGEARLIYGSDRAIALARSHIPEDCEVRTITDYKRLRELPAHAVVLSTGDPMLAGLGYLPGEVVPGISSLQVAFARLRLPLTRAAAVAAHGRDHAHAVETAGREVNRGKIVFLIADPAFSLAELVRALPPATKIAVCENLGYPDERIALGTAAEPPECTAELYVVVAGDF